MSDTVKHLFKVNEIVDQVFLLKKLFFYDQSYNLLYYIILNICSVVFLPALNPGCSSISISSAFPFFLAWLTDEADGS